MPHAPAAPVRPAASRQRWLPRGGALPRADWWPRHRLICVVLALHVPALLGYARVTHHAWSRGLLEVAPIAVLLGVALLPVNRRLRALAASLGLLTCSAVLVQLSGGSIEAHFHYFVAVALTALYEDWTTYLLAIAFVLFEHGLLGAVLPHEADGTDEGGPLTAPVQALFVVAASAAQLVYWRYGEQARERERRYRVELHEGRRSLRARQQQVEETREDLVATVSHEFRTPLTAIRGATLIMRKHRARLGDARVDDMLDAVIENTDRLGRLLENMLTAAEAREPDRDEIADVSEIADEVAALVQATHARTAARIAVAVDPGVEAVVERIALHQILANLLDNAIIHAAPGTQAILSGAVDADEVVITVANEAQGVDAVMLARLFEPFTLADASSTRSRQGAGVGLYVVRRLIEVSAGKLEVRSQPGWVSVEVRLPATHPRRGCDRPRAEADSSEPAAGDPAAGDPAAGKRTARVG